MKQRVKEVIPRSDEQAWARGCDKCHCGITNDPGILAAFPINEGRAVQAADGMIEFCNCRAGHMYRQHARHTFSAMSGELRNNIREHIASVSVPSVHGVTA
jgi:hypothetical protein